MLFRSFSEAEEDGEYIDGYLYGIKGASGIKGSYRKYRNGDARGLFYQANLRFLNYSWGYKMDGQDWTDVNTFVYNPSLVLGYKYHPPILKKRLFIELFAGAGYSYDDPKDGDVKLKFLDDDDDPALLDEEVVVAAASALAVLSARAARAAKGSSPPSPPPLLLLLPTTR